MMLTRYRLEYCKDGRWHRTQINLLARDRQEAEDQAFVLAITNLWLVRVIEVRTERKKTQCPRT